MLGYAIANSKAVQQIEAFEKFLFIELPLQYAGGAIFAVAWRAVGVGRLALNTYSRVISSNTNRVFWSGGNYVRDLAMSYANDLFPKNRIN